MGSKELLEAVDRLGDWLNKTEKLAENILKEIKKKYGTHRLYVDCLGIVRSLRYTEKDFDYLQEGIINKVSEKCP